MLGQSCSRSKASAITLRAALGSIILLHLELAAALSPLSDWYNGTATYYGGPADNMDPYSPSYGTKDVCTYINPAVHGKSYPPFLLHACLPRLL